VSGFSKVSIDQGVGDLTSKVDADSGEVEKEVTFKPNFQPASGPPEAVYTLKLTPKDAKADPLTEMVHVKVAAAKAEPGKHAPLKKGDESELVRVLQFLLNQWQAPIKGLKHVIPDEATWQALEKQSKDLSLLGDVHLCDVPIWKKRRWHPNYSSEGDLWTRTFPSTDYGQVDGLSGKSGVPILYITKLSTDDDGTSGSGDSTKQSATTLKWEGGKSLNSDEIPYLAIGGAHTHDFNIQLGDIGAVIHGGKVAFGVYGDSSGKYVDGQETDDDRKQKRNSARFRCHRSGEASVKLHKLLGVKGGDNSDFIWVVFPGSRFGTSNKLPKNVTSDLIQQRGAALLKLLSGANVQVQADDSPKADTTQAPPPESKDNHPKHPPTHNEPTPTPKKKGDVTYWADDIAAREQKSIQKSSSLFVKKTLTAGGASVDVSELKDLLTTAKNSGVHANDKKREIIVLHWTSSVSTNPGHFKDAKYTVAYYVARDGTVFRYFDDKKYTSVHCNRGNSRAIGIELSNCGLVFPAASRGTSKKNRLPGALYHEALDYEHKGQKPDGPLIYCRTSDGALWKKVGNKTYATFTDAQMKATAKLVKYLSESHKIPFKPLPEAKRGTHLSDKDLAAWTGILTHFNCTSDSGHDDELLQFDWSLLGG
jgi:hypothetical protein